MKGKEIIEYYLHQLEEEGITFVPRWTPPPLAPSAETAASCRKRAASQASVAPEAAQKEGLSSEALGSPSGASEPPAGTPDGGCTRERHRPGPCPSLPVWWLCLSWFPSDVRRHVGETQLAGPSPAQAALHGGARSEGDTVCL